MHWQTIKKSPESRQTCLNLADYEQARATFSWNQVRQELTGLPNDQRLNIAYETIDRHALGPHREQAALRWLGKDGSVRDYSYGRLQELSNRFANVLNSLGVGKSDQILFVSLKTGFQPGEELRRKLLALTRRKLGPAVAPREIEFQASLPKTRSGKIMQRLLKARELRLPEGDLSILKNVTEPGKEANGDGKA